MMMPATIAEARQMPMERRSPLVVFGGVMGMPQHMAASRGLASVPGLVGVIVHP
jgi:hypothetical protein